MEPDPIAENQTDVTISLLMARKDGDVVMSRAVAALLAHSKKLGAELQEVKSSMWSPDALDRRIKENHETGCRECTVRKWVEDYQKQLEHDDRERAKAAKPSLWSFLLSERGLLVIVVILFALMCARTILGPQGYYDVTHTMKESGERK